MIGRAKAHRGDAEARRRRIFYRGSTRMNADQEGQNLPLINADDTDQIEIAKIAGIAKSAKIEKQNF